MCRRGGAVGRGGRSAFIPRQVVVPASPCPWLTASRVLLVLALVAHLVMPIAFTTSGTSVEFAPKIVGVKADESLQRR